ncbi:MAG: hypothetical protein FJW20_13430 [Acidimicrobiia bacterium]|nr:hypothetical protein [Acidimicrobiia bacterium]
MLRSLIIAPNAQLRRELEILAESSTRIYLLDSLDHYPDQEELGFLFATHAPQAIFLDVFSSMDSLEVAARANRFQPAPFVVALHRFRDQFMMAELMRSGIREYLYSPFTEAQLDEAIDRVSEAIRQAGGVTDTSSRVFGFLPSKAGAGSSTTAVQTALALERIPGTRTLLADFDLGAGTSKFLLKLKEGYLIHEALDRAAELDEALWTELAHRVGTLHVLGSSGARPRFRFEPTHLRFLLEFCRRRYKTIVLDFNGVLDDLTVESLAQAQKIFLVVTQEMMSVHMAREKLTLLETLDMQDRVSLLVSRYRKKAPLSLTDVENALSLEAEHVFPEDPGAVNRAILIGGSVERVTELGKEYNRFAEWLVDAPTGDLLKPRWRFLDFFSTLPERYSSVRQAGQ